MATEAKGKRKCSDDAPEAPVPAKKQKTSAAPDELCDEKHCWSVLFTYFTDDYKPRGDDWSRNDGPYLFKSKRKAYTFLRHQLIKYIKGRGEEERLDEIRHDLDAIEEVVEEVATGEYVKNKFSWEMCRIQLHDSKIGPDSESDDDDDETDTIGAAKPVAQAPNNDSDTNENTKVNKSAPSESQGPDYSKEPVAPGIRESKEPVAPGVIGPKEPQAPGVIVPNESLATGQRSALSEGVPNDNG